MSTTAFETWKNSQCGVSCVIGLWEIELDHIKSFPELEKKNKGSLAKLLSLDSAATLLAIWATCENLPYLFIYL